MKILKIVLVILIPALGFVGCKKHQCMPASPAAETTEISAEADNTTLGAKSNEVSIKDDKGGDVVVTGDDDRDGGDKRQKKGAGK